MRFVDNGDRGGWSRSWGGWANDLCLLPPLAGNPPLTARQNPDRPSQSGLDAGIWRGGGTADLARQHVTSA